MQIITSCSPMETDRHENNNSGAQLEKAMSCSFINKWGFNNICLKSHDCW